MVVTSFKIDISWKAFLFEILGKKLKPEITEECGL